MTETRQSFDLVVRAPAKINLSLEVLGERPDGYHEIRSVMQAVSLCDELRFRRRADDRLELKCSHPCVPSGPENLVVRAGRLIQSELDVQRGADVELEKRIPPGGGLGGGSSDGAVALMAFRDLWGAEVPPARLTEFAAELGSDVPFFLNGGTALCEGRGERVSSVPFEGRLFYVVVTPEVEVSTAAVYRSARTGLTSSVGASDNVLKALRGADMGLLARALRNDLQPVALTAYEELDVLRRKLEEVSDTCQIERVLLSGSGSSFFALTGGKEESTKAAEVIADRLAIPCTVVHNLPAWNGRLSMLTTWRTHC
ncbi:MAG: 4-(cytidine 5'-diphospho)-2-C-methyl-D-erythritol kinase [Candidatus Brocadiaceae bacterium]|jgi:4-diphosphocytidyl-2-C-methyl-D-erythritol kinase